MKADHYDFMTNSTTAAGRAARRRTRQMPLWCPENANGHDRLGARTSGVTRRLPWPSSDGAEGIEPASTSLSDK
jgi:hypothetical protein